MRKPFLVFIFLFVAASTRAQISLCTNSASFSGSPATASQDVAFPVGNTAGRGLVVSIQIANNTNTPTAADSRGNIYGASVRRDTVAGNQINTWFAPNAIAGANTVTISGITNGAFRRMAIAECAGITDVDQTTGTSGSSADPSSGTVTTNFASELLYGFAFTGSATAGAGFTQLEYPGSFAMSENRVVLATGFYAATWTAPAGAWLAHIVTFSSSGPPPPPVVLTPLGTPLLQFPLVNPPGNPPAGFDWLYHRADTGLLECKKPDGTSCFPVDPVGGGPANIQIADQAAGADHCAKVQTAITALGGGGFVDARGLRGASTCAGTFTVPRGVFIDSGNWDITPNSTITVNEAGWLTCNIGNAPDTSKSCIFRAKAGLDAPVIACTNAAGPQEWCHWAHIIGIRVEGNSAGQTVRTIAAAPTGASRTTNVSTITTTAAHGFLLGEKALVRGVTDTTFNGAFEITATPTTTTFTYDNVGVNGTSGSGTTNAAPADCIQLNRPGENFFLDGVLVNGCRHSGVRVKENMAGSNKIGQVSAHGSGIALNFDRVSSTNVTDVFKGDGNEIFLAVSFLAGQGGALININKLQAESVGADNDPFILHDGRNSGGMVNIELLAPPSGTHTNIIKCIGGNDCAFNIKHLSIASGYTNLILDEAFPGGTKTVTTADAGPVFWRDKSRWTWGMSGAFLQNLGFQTHTLTVNNGTTNQLDFVRAPFLRLIGPTADFNIGGSTDVNQALCGQNCTPDGLTQWLFNDTAFSMCFLNESGASKDVTRIVTKTGGTVCVGPKSLAFLMYEKVNKRWHLLNDPYSATTATALTSAMRDANGDLITRRYLVAGTSHVAGDYVPSAAWGSTASVAVDANSKDASWRITVTSAGVGQAANPTVILTFKDLTWTTIPICTITQQGGTGARADVNVSTTATTATLTWVATPVAGLTYIFAGNPCTGR